MALRETHVEIDFISDTSGLRDIQRESNNVLREMQYLRNEFDMQGSRMNDLSDESKAMLRSMRNDWAMQRTSANKYRDELMKIKYGYHELTKSSLDYNGSNRAFMKEVQALGRLQKQVTDQMLQDDIRKKASMLQQVGTMLNTSTQASKVFDNYKRMGNPFYLVNAGALKVADGLNKIALAGRPAALALKMLGPSANMKQLSDMTRLISTGLMRFQLIALGAVVANVLLMSSLHKAATSTIPGYGAAFKAMTAAVRQAFQPMVEVFAMVMMPVYRFITAVANLVIKFNEAHPIMARFIQGFMLLVVVLTLILSPLAIGIGLLGGFAAAFSFLWTIIGPVITGIAAMSATVWIVAAALIALGAVFYLLWTRSELFRSTVIAGWNAIKAAALSVWGFISPYIQQAMTTVTTFVQQKLAQLQAFWTANGSSIKQAVSNVWNVIMTIIRAAMVVLVPIIQVAFMLVKSIIVSTWNAIKNVINGALQVIMGIVQVFTGLFTGNFTQMWAGVKQIFFGTLEVIWGMINLYFIGKFLAPLRSFGGILLGLMRGAWNGIKGIVTGSLTAVGNAIRTYFNLYQSVITGAMNLIRGVVTGAWNAIKAGVSAAVNSIRSAVSGGFNSIQSVITGVMNTVRSVVTAVWNSILSTVTGALNSILSSVRSTFNNMLSAITSIMNNVKTAISSAFDSALSIVTNLGTSFYNAGRGLIEQIIGGISSMAGSVTRKIEEVVGNLRDHLPFSPAKIGPLSDLDKLDFGGPIGDSIKKAMPKVAADMNMLMKPGENLASMSSMSPEQSVSNSSTQQSRSINFAPVYNIQVSGDAGGADNIKQQLDEHSRDMFASLTDIFGTEVAY